jgi:hypothetical protein
MSKHIDSFLHNLKIIIKETSQLLPNDPIIYRTNKRLLLAIQYDPLRVFTIVGKYLYKYKDFVYDATTEDLLFNTDFSKEVQNVKDTEVGEIALLLIDQIKKCLMAMPDHEKKIFRKLTSELLDDYIEYNVNVS